MIIGVQTWRVFLGICLFLIFVARVAMVIWGEGFNVPDELFQFVEPAWGLLSNPWYATWEWERGLRSWVAPGIIAGVLRVSTLLGWTSSDAMMIWLRAFCSLLSLSWSVWFYRRLLPHSSSRWAWSSLIVFSVWPVTLYFSVRTMGETLSASLFFGVLLLIFSSFSFKRLFLAGLLMGLCFSIRFQMALLVIAVFGLLAYERKWKELIPFASGAGLWLLAQGLLDLWTWGHFLHSPIQYLMFNGIEGGAAEQFGADPWHRYLSLLNRWFSLPAVFVVLIGLWGSIKWRHRMSDSREVVWSWVLLLAFFVPHTLTSHKEDRFLLPIYPILVWLVCVGLYLIRSHGKLLSSKFAIGLFALLVFVSFIHRSSRMPWQNNLDRIHAWEQESRWLRDGMRVAYFGELPSLFYMRRDLTFLDKPHSPPGDFVARILGGNSSEEPVDAWVITREMETIVGHLKAASYSLGKRHGSYVFVQP